MVGRFIPRLKNDQRKESILHTAIKLIAVNGFENTSMREIAQEEGISEVILYRNFRNKYKILETLLEFFVPIVTKSFKEFLQSIEAMVTDLRISLPMIGKMYLNRIQEFPYFIMFITKEGDKIPNYLAKADKKYLDDFDFEAYRKILFEELQLKFVFTKYFTRCKKEGFLREDLLPEDCANIVLSLFLPLIIRSPLTPLNKPLTEKEFEEVINRQVKIVLYAFLPLNKQ